MTGRVIVLNGVGSVGKTSAAKAFQRIAVDPFLHVSGDDFLDMIAPVWLVSERAAWVTGVALSVDGGQSKGIR